MTSQKQPLSNIIPVEIGIWIYNIRPYQRRMVTWLCNKLTPDDINPSGMRKLGELDDCPMSMLKAIPTRGKFPLCFRAVA